MVQIWLIIKPFYWKLPPRMRLRFARVFSDNAHDYSKVVDNFHEILEMGRPWKKEQSIIFRGSKCRFESRNFSSWTYSTTALGDAISPSQRYGHFEYHSACIIPSLKRTFRFTSSACGSLTTQTNQIVLHLSHLKSHFTNSYRLDYVKNAFTDFKTFLDFSCSLTFILFIFH